jgi:hypothetical protein
MPRGRRRRTSTELSRKQREFLEHVNKLFPGRERLSIQELSQALGKPPSVVKRTILLYRRKKAWPYASNRGPLPGGRRRGRKRVEVLHPVHEPPGEPRTIMLRRARVLSAAGDLISARRQGSLGAEDQNMADAMNAIGRALKAVDLESRGALLRMAAELLDGLHS